MQNKSAQIAALAGGASAILAVLAVIMPLTIFLVPLPLFLSGLIGQSRGLLIASGAASFAIAIAAGISGLMFYWSVMVFPVVAAIRLSGPRTLITGTLWGDIYALYALVSMITIVIGMNMMPPELKENLINFVVLAYQEGMQNIDQTTAREMAEMAVSVLPGGMALMWISMLMLNLGWARRLAERLLSNSAPQTDSRQVDPRRGTDTDQGELEAADMLRRFTPWTEIAMPRLWDVMLAVLLLGTYLPSIWGDIAGQLLLPAMFGFVLVGLGTIHIWAQHMISQPAILLVPTYILLLTGTLFVAPVIAAIGLADHIINLKGRLPRQAGK